MKTQTLHRISLLSLLKFGFFVGLVTTFFPNLALILVSWWILRWFVDWLTSLTYSFSLPVPGLADIEVQVVELLKVQDLVDQLETLADAGWLPVFLLVLGATLAAGGFFALLSVLAGAIFNLVSYLSAGLEFTLAEKAPEALPALPNQELPAQAFLGGPRLEIGRPVQQTAPLMQAMTMIGSDASCSLVLPGLQPRHAQISYENGRYIFQDFSQGQSEVQGQVVRGLHMLKDGFTLKLGAYLMVFRQ